MCGIVYIEDFKGRAVNKGVVTQYLLQKNRGQQGFGLYDGQHIVRATKEKRILNWLGKHESSLIMFHHRFPTSTPNVKRAAHPLSTGQYFGDTQYIMVHNGIIRNDDDLFIRHQELGIEYRTLLTDLKFNDSEALLWDFALWQEGKQDKMNAVGDMAFICMKVVKGKPDRLFFYRNYARPLNLLRSREGLMLSSEGEGEPIKADTLYTWYEKAHRLHQSELDVPVYERGNWDWNSKKTKAPIPYADPLRDYYDEEEDYYRYGSFPSAFTPGSVAARASNQRDAADDEEGLEDWLRGRAVESETHASTRQWLRDILKDRYHRYFNHDDTPKPVMESAGPTELLEGEVIEVRDNSGLYVPKDDRKQGQMLFVERQYLTPSDEEIDNTVTAYLGAHQGHFESAHWNIESDFAEMEDLPQTETVLREKVLLELALQRLDANPEYENEESISSEWRALWAQAQLA